MKSKTLEQRVIEMYRKYDREDELIADLKIRMSNNSSVELIEEWIVRVFETYYFPNFYMSLRSTGQEFFFRKNNDKLSEKIVVIQNPKDFYDPFKFMTTRQAAQFIYEHLGDIEIDSVL